MNRAPTADSNPVSGSMATSSDTNNTVLTDLLQQMQNVFGSDPTAASAAGTASASASFPVQAALASLTDALTTALADLGITAPQFGNGSASVDTSLLTQLSPNQGQDGPGGVSSLTPSWWPSGGNLADFQSAAQFQAGLAGDFDGWVGCMANVIQVASGSGAAAGGLAGEAKGGASGAVSGAATGGLWGAASGVVLGAVICTVEEFQKAPPSSGTGSPNSQTAPAATPRTEVGGGSGGSWGSADVKVEESLSSWSKSADVKIELDPSDYGKTSDQGTKSMPNPDADPQARGSGSPGAGFWQLVASHMGGTCPDPEHHQVTEADIQKLLSTMIVSIISKVNPNPEATPQAAGGTAGGGASKITIVTPVVGVIDGGLGGDEPPVNNGGGTLRGPKPAVGPGVPSGPKG